MNKFCSLCMVKSTKQEEVISIFHITSETERGIIDTFLKEVAVK